ncbi:unnamed protein product [Brassica oleracea var. botrytis]
MRQRMKEETTEKKCSESVRRGHGEEELRGVGASKISTVVLFGVFVFGCLKLLHFFDELKSFKVSKTLRVQSTTYVRLESKSSGLRVLIMSCKDFAEMIKFIEERMCNVQNYVKVTATFFEYFT